MKAFDKGLYLISQRPIPKDVVSQLDTIQNSIDDPMEYYEFKRLYAPILMHLINSTTNSCKRVG